MTGNNKDYEVDISLNDGGTLDQILKRLQAIDSQIAQTVAKTTDFQNQMSRMASKSKVEGNTEFDRVRSEIDAAKKALQELNRERDLWAKSGSRTVDSAFGGSAQTGQLKAQMETFKRLLKEPYLNAGTEIENQLKKLQKQQMLAYNNLKKQQAELERMQVINRIGTSSSPEQFLRGRSNAEIVGLGSFARSNVTKSLALGDKQAAIVAQKAVDVIKSTLADQLAPAIKDRLKIATGLVGNQASIKSFVEQNSKQEVRETVKALRKQASTLSMLEVNSPQARDAAKLADQLNELSKVTKLSAANLKNITRDINQNGIANYSGKSTNEITTIRSAIKTEFGKAVREGRTEDASKYENAQVKLGQLLDTINSPTRLNRINALRAAASSEDLKSALATLTAGKTKSGIEQLLGDAKKLYASDKEKFGEAEELRKVVAALKELVNSNNKVNKVTKLSTENLNQITRDINQNGVNSYSGKSTKELVAIQSAIKSEFNKAVREGRKDDAKKFETAESRLGQLLESINNPTRQNRFNVLRSVAGADDFKSAVGNLTRGKSQSGLEQLLGDAKRLYSSDKDKYGEAEDLRKLVAALKELVSNTNKVNKEIKLERQKTPNQELAAYEAVRVSQLASQRYNGRLMPSNLAQMSIGQLETVSGEAKLALKAQELRVARAKESKTDVQSELNSLNILKQQTRELEDQLRIKKQLESQDRRRNSAEVIQAQARAAAESQAARNSPEAIRQSILRDITRNEEKRRIDNGADMFQNQAMLLRNYAIMGTGVGAAGSSANFVVQLDKGFAQLQSILALTNNDMEEMKTNLIEISELTKFDTVQVVDAAVLLGQAGLSKEQITESLAGVTLFATAVGTDLASAVDLATSAVGVFNIQASRMPEVVDKLTIAINKSKLNMDKLSLGLQYAGNIAEQSNVSFDETVAALAAMANSGIKSGSTLGTGLRQILITLQKPSEAFIRKIQDLGLRMSDLDLNTHSLVDIMGTLSAAGFTVVDAMQTMEVRTASAFSAFSNNLDVAKSITKEMEGSGAATEANNIQMQALANQWERFASIAKSIVYNALEPMVVTMTELIKVGGDFLTTYRGIADVLQVIILGLTTIQGIRLAKGAVGLLARVSGRGRSDAIENVREAVTAGGSSVTRAMSATDKAAIAATIAPWILRFLGGPVVLATGLGISTAMYVANSMSKEARLNDKLDKARKYSNDVQAERDKQQLGLTTVDSLTNEAFYRRSTLEKLDSSAMTEFVKKMNNELKNLGFFMEETRPSFDKVIEKLQELRTNLTELSSINIGRAAVAAQEEKTIMLERLAKAERDTVFTKNLDPKKKGFSDTGLVGYNSDEQDYKVSMSLLSRTSPELYNLLDRKNPQGMAPYTLGMAELSADTSEETVRKLKVRNQQILSELQTFELNNPRSAVSKMPNTSEYAVTALYDELKALREELNKDQDELGNILSKFEKVSSAKNDAAVGEVSNKLREDYQMSVREILSDIGRKKSTILEDRKLSPLSQYDQLLALDAEAKSKFGAQNDALRNSGRALVERGELSPELLGEALERTGLPGSMNQLVGEMTADLREVSKAALQDLRKRTNAKTQALNSRIEELGTERQEATDPARINQLGVELEKAIKERSEVELRLKRMEALVSENPEQFADVSLSVESKRAEDIELNRIQTARQLAQYNAMKNFQNGNFNLPTAGETNNSDIAKTAKQYFSLFNSEIQKSLTDARGEAEVLREKADESRNLSENATRRANDQGLPLDFQAMEVSKAIDALQDVFEAIKKAIDVERSALVSAIKKDSEQLTQLQKQAAELQDGNPVKAAFKAQMAVLNQNISESQKRLAVLHRDETESARQNLEAAKVLRGELELRYNAERPYLRESKRRTKAMIDGSEFRTDEQIRNEESGQQLTAKPDGVMGQMGNVWKYSTEEAAKAYEGFDAMTEMAEGLAETMASLGDTAGSFFAEFVKGSMSGKDAVKGFALSVVSSLADMAAKIAMNQIMMMVMQSFAGSFGGSSFAGAGSGAPAMWTGGEVRRYATGGLIVGGPRSTKTRDSTLINAAPGEYVLRSRAVKALGLDTVEFLNQQDESTIRSMQNLDSPAAPEESRSGGTVNVWIVSEDEKPQTMDEQSTLVIIDKALRRKSSTRQLVKQIAMGDL